jgi:hypothetical protein
LHVADQKNREKIQRQNTDINLKWTNTINSIDNQIETLSQIAQNWTDLERDINAIEKSVGNLAEKIKEIDFGQKPQPVLEDLKNTILVSRKMMTRAFWIILNLKKNTTKNLTYFKALNPKTTRDLFPI